jgi:hypothetical protein
VVLIEENREHPRAGTATELDAVERFRHAIFAKLEVSRLEVRDRGPLRIDRDGVDVDNVDVRGRRGRLIECGNANGKARAAMPRQRGAWVVSP